MTTAGIGQRLKQVREALGLTQKQIAEAIEGKLPSWKDYESGKSTPGGKVIASLVRLGVNANWILTGDGPMLNPEPSAPAPAGRAQPGGIGEHPSAYHLDGDSPKDRIIRWIEEFWERASPDERAWFRVQMVRTFPELAGRLLPPGREAGEEP